MAAPTGKMSLFKVVYIFAVLNILISAESRNKYSADVNEGSLKTERNFRMNKVNLVWEKALKRLKLLHLADLYAELKIHDKLEIEAKRKRTDGFDDDGEFEAVVRAKLLDILTRYDLHDHWQQGESNRIAENESVDDPKVAKYDAIKMDKKLGKLWKKAEMSGFTEKQLSDLKKEFHHHQKKIDEFNQLKNEIDVMEGISDNSIDTFKNPQMDRKILKNKRSDLKDRHRSLKDSYAYLEELANVDELEKIEFSDPKVIELWLLAKRVNFSEMELQSFKEELRHFEHKVLKHEHYQKELRASQDKPFQQDKDNAAQWSQDDLEKKVTDYGYKVKKYHTELKMRIAKAMEYHTEL